MNTQTPEIVSDTFATIKRIDERISQLFKVLESVIQSSPAEADDKGYDTKLSADLHRLEARVDNLLAVIKL